MAPSGRTTTTTSTRTTSRTATTRTRRTRQQRRTTNFKKQKQQHNNTKIKSNKKQQEIQPSSSSSSTSSQDSCNSKELDNMHGFSDEVIDVVCNNDDNNNSPCSTPKGQKFRIPEISTCPPAPKKPRVLSNCSLRRSPLSFFAPPDLEHFFFVALRDVSV